MIRDFIHHFERLVNRSQNIFWKDRWFLTSRFFLGEEGKSNIDFTSKSWHPNHHISHPQMMNISQFAGGNTMEIDSKIEIKILFHGLRHVRIEIVCRHQWVLCLRRIAICRKWTSGPWIMRSWSSKDDLSKEDERARDLRILALCLFHVLGAVRNPFSVKYCRLKLARMTRLPEFGAEMAGREGLLFAMLPNKVTQKQSRIFWASSQADFAFRNFTFTRIWFLLI